MKREPCKRCGSESQIEYGGGRIKHDQIAIACINIDCMAIVTHCDEDDYTDAVEKWNAGEYDEI